MHSMRKKNLVSIQDEYKSLYLEAPVIDNPGKFITV